MLIFQKYQAPDISGIKWLSALCLSATSATLLSNTALQVPYYMTHMIWLMQIIDQSKKSCILFSLQILVWCQWRKASICQSQQLSNTSVRTAFHKQNHFYAASDSRDVGKSPRLGCWRTIQVVRLLQTEIMDLSPSPGNSDINTFFSLLETRTENIRRDWSHFHHVQWHAHPSCQILQVFHKKIATMKLRFQFYNCDFRMSDARTNVILDGWT